MITLKFNPDTPDLDIMQELQKKNLYCIRFKYGYTRRNNDLKAKIVLAVPNSWR